MQADEDVDESPLDEYKSEIVGRWHKLRDYWRDRLRILAQPQLALAVPRRLHNKPLAFATQSLVILPLIIGVFAPITDFLFDLPPTPPERELRKHERALDWTEKALATKAEWPPVPDDIPSALGLQLVSLQLYQRTPAADPVLVRLREDLRKTIVVHRAVARTSQAVDSLQIPVIGLAFIVNSYLFRYLLRQMRPEAGYRGRAHVFHLYYVSARLFWPTFFLAAGTAFFAFVDRFTGNSPIGEPLLIYAVAGVWALLLLRRSRGVFADTFPPVLDEIDRHRWGNRVVNRLIFSNMGTNAIAIAALTAVVSALLYVAVQRAG